MSSNRPTQHATSKYRPCYTCTYFGGFAKPQAEEAGQPVKLAKCLRASVQVDRPARQGCNRWLHLAGTPNSELPPW